VGAAVALLPGSTCASAAEGLPAFGLNEPLVAGGPIEPARAAELNRELGSTVIRIPVPWSVVEPAQNGGYRWEPFDAQYRLAGDYGLRVIALIIAPPLWAITATGRLGCPSPSTGEVCHGAVDARAADDLTRFSAALAKRYPGLHAIEAFNEPNLGIFWRPRPDPQSYGVALRAVLSGVRSVSASMPVISAGLSPTGESSTAQATRPDHFLRSLYAAGVMNGVGRIGIHPYPGASSPDSVVDSGFHILLDRIRGVRDSAGDTGARLWITEVGIPTSGTFSVTPDEQARRLRVLVSDAFTMTDVDAVIVHTLIDAGGERQAWGLINTSLVRKPAFRGLQTLLRDRRAHQSGLDAIAARRRARAHERKARRSCKRASMCLRASRR
jgi:hypothetical protein